MIATAGRAGGKEDSRIVGESVREELVRVFGARGLRENICGLLRKQADSSEHPDGNEMVRRDVAGLDLIKTILEAPA